MPSGAKPGERRGGRAKGTPNKNPPGSRRKMLEAMREARRISEDKIEFDSLEQLRKIAKVLMGLGAQEQQREPPNHKFLVEVLESASRVLNYILPYEHRRLATLEPQMETVVRPDGSVHVTISKTDSEL